MTSMNHYTTRKRSWPSPRIVVLEGPEKAGKTTLATAIIKEATSRGLKVRPVKWGPLPDGRNADKVYAESLLEEVVPGADHDLVVWDRGWVSELVYAALLNRDRRLRDDPWLGEWLYGRWVQAVGLRLMVLGPHHEVLASRRDSSDLPVSPEAEQRLFAQYAQDYRWARVLGYPRVDVVAARVVDSIEHLKTVHPSPLEMCGPHSSAVVFVGEAPSEDRSRPGAELPFTSRYTETCGRKLGDLALRVAWTNASFRPDVSSFSLAVACGRVAERYLSEVGFTGEVVHCPHPAALYRWGRYGSEITHTEESIATAVRSALKEEMD